MSLAAEFCIRMPDTLSLGWGPCLSPSEIPTTTLGPGLVPAESDHPPSVDTGSSSLTRMTNAQPLSSGRLAKSWWGQKKWNEASFLMPGRIAILGLRI